jgi:hypothetical protein
MRLLLPAVASPYVLRLLFAASGAVHRAGAATLPPSALTQFAAALASQVLQAYSKAAGTADAASEKGVLQLLFDVRFALDVLRGGSEDPGPANRLEDQLQAQLDPIDWATYELYLWANEARFYQRTAVLFGALVQLKRLHTGPPARLPPTAETNTLNAANVIPRLTYLPVSAPLSTSKSDPSAQSAAVSSSPAGRLAKANGNSAAQVGVAAEAEGGGSGFKGLGSYMGSVGSKFHGVTGSFGSLGSVWQADKQLKDKSAEAMATFGNMFGATPLTSWASKREA